MRKKDDTVPEELMRKAGVLRRPKIAYYPVCGSQYVRPSIGASTVLLFERLKLDFVIPENVCCGLPAASYGVLDQVRAMAKLNIEHVERGAYESLVVDDNSCAAHFKDYPKYFHDDREMLARAQALSHKIRDLSTFFVQRGLLELLKKVTWNGGPVAYHDPCKAQHAQKIVDPPRELLKAINRLTLIPVTEADQCCGGGGTYSLTHPELSGSVLDRKISHIQSSGCKILVTASTSCLLQLSHGLRKVNSTIPVLHLTEFLERALQK
jgi:glycolate oxidase iron-sulfur subunit